MNFLIIKNNFKHDRFFALYDVIHDANYIILMMTLHNVSVGQTETTGAGVEKVKISANPDNFMTKIFLAILFRK